MVEKGAIVVTDEWGAYNGLDKNFTHEVLKHNEGEFVNTNNFHTNSVEGFWSLLKRGIYGIYHSVSPEHLHRYCNEFGLRYNTRLVKDQQRFVDVFNQVENVHLSYKNLIGKNGKKDNGAETEIQAI